MMALIVANNGLSPIRHQVMIYTNGGFLLIGPSEADFNEIEINIQELLYNKWNFASKMSRPQSVGKTPRVALPNIWRLRTYYHDIKCYL